MQAVSADVFYAGPDAEEITVYGHTRFVGVSEGASAIDKAATYADSATSCPKRGTYRSRGTIAAPADVQQGDVLAQYLAYGRSSGFRSCAAFTVWVDGTPSGSVLPMAIGLETGPSADARKVWLHQHSDGALHHGYQGSETIHVAMAVDATGDWTITPAGGTVRIVGTIQASDFAAGDGSPGMTGNVTLASVTQLVVKNGLIVGTV